MCVCVCQYFFNHTTLENYHPRNANLSNWFTNTLIPISKANKIIPINLNRSISTRQGALRMVVGCMSGTELEKVELYRYTIIPVCKEIK